MDAADDDFLIPHQESLMLDQVRFRLGAGLLSLAICAAGQSAAHADTIFSSLGPQQQFPSYVLITNNGAAAGTDTAHATSFTVSFQNAHYTPKVVRQMKLPDFHGFPAVTDKFAARFGEVTSRLGRDGAMYEHLQMPGGYLGREGIFHYIKNNLSGAINHRMFEPY